MACKKREQLYTHPAYAVATRKIRGRFDTGLRALVQLSSRTAAICCLRCSLMPRLLKPCPPTGKLSRRTFCREGLKLMDTAPLAAEG